MIKFKLPEALGSDKLFNSFLLLFEYKPGCGFIATLSEDGLSIYPMNGPRLYFRVYE